MKRKIVSLALSLVMMLTIFAGCGAPAEQAQTESVGASSGTAQPSASPEATATPTPSPEPTPAVDLEHINVLTGLPTMSDEGVGLRPVAVMVNNVNAAMPQYGISAADVIYELHVEADQTRLMAVFGDQTKIPDVCSIRSCRYYYPLLAVAMDAVYIHCGIDGTIATETVNRLDIDRVDGGWYGEGDYFKRDYDRLNSGYAWEHTFVFRGENLPALLEARNIRPELREDRQEEYFNFCDYDEVLVPGGEVVKKVRVDFGLNYSVFTYDPKTHTYFKSYQNYAHEDQANGEQLNFENVLVLETDVSVRDAKGRKNINVTGGPSYTGYYFSEGRMEPITWQKDGDYEKLKFYKQNGNELQLNRGKTYIGFTYFDYITLNPEE